MSKVYFLLAVLCVLASGFSLGVEYAIEGISAGVTPAIAGDIDVEVGAVFLFPRFAYYGAALVGMLFAAAFYAVARRAR